MIISSSGFVFSHIIFIHMFYLFIYLKGISEISQNMIKSLKKGLFGSSAEHFPSSLLFPSILCFLPLLPSSSLFPNYRPILYLSLFSIFLPIRSLSFFAISYFLFFPLSFFTVSYLLFLSPSFFAISYFLFFPLSSFAISYLLFLPFSSFTISISYSFLSRLSLFLSPVPSS